jgi:hypothetical protein
MKTYGNATSETADTVDHIAIATTSLSGFLLGVVRISEPLVWRKVKQIVMFAKIDTKEASDDAWTQPISVIVQSKLNTELTNCIFESLHTVFLRLSETRTGDEDDDDFASASYKKRGTHTIKKARDSMSMWGVKDQKLNGVVIETYALDVFADIILKCEDSMNDVLASLNPENNLHNEVNQSEGKSGSFFLFTKDKRLSIKTIKRGERRLMLRFLKDYHEHISHFPETLLCKIYGVFTLKVPGVTAVDLLVMQNVFYKVSPLTVYDIKGSTAGRTSKKHGQYLGPLKDLDFIEKKERLFLTQEDIQKLEFNLLKDVKVLKKNRLMDYSMLIGTSEVFDNGNRNRNSYMSMRRDMMYTMGIIDFLTEYGYWKSIERSFAAMRYGKLVKQASVANPARYSNRFFNFIFSVVVPIIRRNSSFIIKED